MRRIATLIFCIMFFGNVHAQLQDRIWIFGRPVSGTTNATLYFGTLSNPVMPLPCGQPNQITTSNGYEEWAVVTNPATGNLIFYTDGMNVFDKFHNLIDIDTTTPGFESLGANPSSSQPVAISLVPGAGANGFYIFSNETGANAYSIDIGKITYRLYNAISNTFGPTLNLPGPYSLTNVSEGMKIIPCETDPNVLWLITSLFPVSGMQNRYVVYKINQSIVTFQSEVDMGPNKLTSGGSGASPIINITYTEANTTTGVTRVGFSNQYVSSVFICDFDNINGQFLTGTARTYLSGWSGYIPSVYDLEFSPNGNFLYYTAYYTNGNTNDLYQINLQNNPLSAVMVHRFNNRYAGGMKLGPDGLIYHISDNGYFSDTAKLGRILQPNVAYIPGVTNFSQFYQENFQRYPHIYATAMSEFLILPTTLTGISEQPKQLDLADIYIYPNPATDYIYYSISGAIKSASLTMHDMAGRMVLERAITSNTGSINVRGLQRGIYLLRLYDEYNVLTRKVIME